MKSAPPELAATKRPYSAPRLRPFGSLTALTRSVGSSGKNDGGDGMGGKLKTG